MKKVLNVGGYSKKFPLPAEYAGFEHLMLDIDPKTSPDILCDARMLTGFQPAQFDAIYCSHNLEHYYRHDVPKVLAGFRHVLKENGFAHIVVPDLNEVMKAAVTRDLDVDDVLYKVGQQPITILDVLYGLGAEIEQSGQDFFAHKTGFTLKSLLKAIRSAGFSKLFGYTDYYQAIVLAFKGSPDEETRTLFKLPPG